VAGVKLDEKTENILKCWYGTDCC